MAYVTPVAADLSTYLGADVDASRATMLLGLAQSLCLAVVSPLPAGAEAVVLDVAARAFVNPANVTEQATGPYIAAYGSVGGGLWLTAKNEGTLRRLSGSGLAFTIDLMPADAGPANAWAQVPEVPGEAFNDPPFYGDFDQIP